MEIKKDQEYSESSLAQLIGAAMIVGVVLLAPLALIFRILDEITKFIFWIFKKL